ncbi:hypothetical protein CCYA_CCYA08G2303 [Cyanidiococcus yangmingshanensis]|nr:hypothetical protein CCYA_CCYA08G2303 [Cyanidiococcus yangmingshanensis]
MTEPRPSRRSGEPVPGPFQRHAGVIATVDPGRWLSLSPFSKKLRDSVKFIVPSLQRLVRITTFAYAVIAGATSALTWLATLQPDFSLYTFVPFTYRMQRRLHALSFDVTGTDEQQSRMQTPARPSDKCHDSVRVYAETVLQVLLEAPGLPPNTQAQVHLEPESMVTSAGPEPEFVMAVDDGPLFATRCVHRFEGSPSDANSSTILDIYVSPRIDPSLVPAALSHSLAHGIANHAAEALSTLFYGAVPVSAWRPRCLLNMITPAPLAARWQGGSAEAARWVVDTLHRFRAPLVTLCMRPVQRQNEFEADLIAAMMLARVGLDPHAMLELLHRAKIGAVTSTLNVADNASEVSMTTQRVQSQHHPQSFCGRYPSIERRMRHLQRHMERLKRLETLVQKSEGERSRRIGVLHQRMERQLAQVIRASRASKPGAHAEPSPQM